MRTGLVAFVLAVAVAAAQDKARDVRANTTDVWVFKNGYVLLTQEVTVESGKTYRVVNLAPPSHGTFWVETDTAYEMWSEQETVQSRVEQVSTDDIIATLKGRQVTLFLKDGSTVKGKVAFVTEEGVFSKSVKFVVVETADGLEFVEFKHIRRIKSDLKKADFLARRTKPVLYLRLKGEGRHKVVFRYLTYGVAWAPAYRLLLKGEKLEIRMQAVLRNQLMDLKDVNVRFVSGFPNIPFAGVISLMRGGRDIETFLKEIRRAEQRRGGAPSIASQAFVETAIPEERLPAVIKAYQEGPDIHIKALGKRTVLKGQSIYVELAKAETAFKNLILCDLPTKNDSSSRGRLPEAWDVIGFVNPFEFPLTTAPVTIYSEDGRLLGQSICYWTDPKAECLVRVNRSLSVRVEYEEEEDVAFGRRGETVNMRPCIRVQKIVKISIANRRQKNLNIVLRFTQHGTFVSAQPKPNTLKHLPSRSELNPCFQTVWRLTLKPAATKSVTLTYQRLIR